MTILAMIGWGLTAVVGAIINPSLKRGFFDYIYIYI